MKEELTTDRFKRTYRNYPLDNGSVRDYGIPSKPNKRKKAKKKRKGKK